MQTLLHHIEGRAYGFRNGTNIYSIDAISKIRDLIRSHMARPNDEHIRPSPTAHAVVTNAARQRIVQPITQQHVMTTATRCIFNVCPFRNPHMLATNVGNRIIGLIQVQCHTTGHGRCIQRIHPATVPQGPHLSNIAQRVTVVTGIVIVVHSI